MGGHKEGQRTAKHFFTHTSRGLNV